MCDGLPLAGLCAIGLVVSASAAPWPRGEWPLPGHDNRYSARAELPCDMPVAPQEAWSYDPGLTPLSAALCADVNDDGQDELLYGDWPLVCCSLDGAQQWRSPVGKLIAVADLDGDGRTELVGSALERHDNAKLDGQVCVIAGRDGKVLWERPGPRDVISGCRVGRLLPNEPGLQLSCVSEDAGNGAKRAQIWSFAQGCEKARLVWQRDFTPYGEHSAPVLGRWSGGAMALISATWGGVIAMRLEDGTDLWRFYFECAPGAAGKRNYGPMLVTDLDGDGRAEIAILACKINLHLTVLAPWRGDSGRHGAPENPLPAPDVPMGELASYPDGPVLWQRYFGDSQPTGEYLLDAPLGPVADVDGDGRQEIVVNIRTDTWALKIYDGMTGAELLSLPGVRAEALCDLDGDGGPELIAREGSCLVIGTVVRNGPNGLTWTERGRFEGRLLAYASAPRATCDEVGIETAPLSISTDRGQARVVTDAQGRVSLLEGGPGQAFSLSEFGPAGAAEGPPDALAPLASSGGRLVAAERTTPRLCVLSRDGAGATSWGAGAPVYAGATVADIDADGRNELLVCRADGRLAALCADGPPGAPLAELWTAAGAGFPQAYPRPFPVALAADLNSDGRQELLVAGGRGGRLLDYRGTVIWETHLPLARATFGDFTGDGKLDIYAAALVPPTAGDSAGARLHSYALNGRDGSVIWHNDGRAQALWHHQMGPTPTWAMPTVCDLNGDGVDDVLFVALDMVVALNGRDGSMLQEPIIANRIWAEHEGKDTQWTAYGTQIPVDLNGDGALEILLAASWGQWGAWTLHRKLLWTFDPGKEALARRRPGVADVDGDGRLEVGVIHDDGAFRCYDATSGALKWELPSVRQTSDVVTADVDGDGIAEFVASLAAYKAVSPGEGRVLWEVDVPVSQSPPVVADLDGDGRCEIIVGLLDGTLRAYKGRPDEGRAVPSD